jgi:hypothetical protein
VATSREVWNSSISWSVVVVYSDDANVLFASHQQTCACRTTPWRKEGGDCASMSAEPRERCTLTHTASSLRRLAPPTTSAPSSGAVDSPGLCPHRPTLPQMDPHPPPPTTRIPLSGCQALVSQPCESECFPRRMRSSHPDRRRRWCGRCFDWRSGFGSERGVLAAVLFPPFRR